MAEELIPDSSGGYVQDPTQNEEDLHPGPTRQGVEPMRNPYDSADIQSGADVAFDTAGDFVADVGAGVEALLGGEESVAQRPRDRVTSRVSPDLPSFVELLNALPPTVERTMGTEGVELDRAGQLATLQAVATFLKTKADGGDQQAIADLASVQRVLTAAAKTPLEDPDLATRPPTTAQGTWLDDDGWNSSETRSDLTFERNSDTSEGATPFAYTIADIARNPGNVRPEGNWGVESGAVDPNSDLGKALLDTDPSGGRRYFIGSARDGSPVSADDDRAVVLLEATAPSGTTSSYLVFNDYKDGIRVQVENITRQVVGREKDTFDKLVDRWAPKFKADGITIENTDEERTAYKDNLKQTFQDFGLLEQLGDEWVLPGGKIDGTDAKHVVALVLAMWQTEAGSGKSRITVSDIMGALYDSKMAVGIRGRAETDGLKNKDNLGLSISGDSVTMNGHTRNLR